MTSFNHECPYRELFFNSRVCAARLAGPIVTLRFPRLSVSLSVCASVTVWEGLRTSQWHDSWCRISVLHDPIDSQCHLECHQ